jgi:hypothetical protein
MRVAREAGTRGRRIHGTADTISPIEGGYSRHLGPNGEPRGLLVLA